MNILFYAYCGFNPKNGGTERVSDILAKEFKKKGHDVFFVTWRSGSPDNTFTPIGQIIQLPNQRKICSKKNVSVFIDYLLKHKIDVIICQHSFEVSFARLAYLVKEKTGSKLLYAFHSTPRFMTATIEAVRARSILPSENNLFKKYRTITRLLFKKQKLKSYHQKTSHLFNKLHEWGDGIILLSNKYISVVQEIANIRSSEKLFAIENPNTYDETEIQETEIQETEKENTLLFVGRLSPEKGPEKTLQVWQKIQWRFPDWNLKVVGDGILRRDMEILKCTLNLERCFLEGRQESLPYYRTAKILLVTSNFEGFPVTLTEAMQNKVVPVAFNSFDALSDIVDDNITGLSVTPYDIDAFKEKLTFLMTNEGKRREMAKAAKISVQRFSLPEIVQKWTDLFLQLGII